ncbi:MAG: hypothetical protein QM770_05505 [Tepidisphaeraceae bacterium]
MTHGPVFGCESGFVDELPDRRIFVDACNVLQRIRTREERREAKDRAEQDHPPSGQVQRAASPAKEAERLDQHADGEQRQREMNGGHVDVRLNELGSHGVTPDRTDSGNDTSVHRD